MIKYHITNKLNAVQTPSALEFDCRHLVTLFVIRLIAFEMVAKKKEQTWISQILTTLAIVGVFVIGLAVFVAMVFAVALFDWRFQIICLVPIFAFSRWLFGDNVIEMGMVAFILFTVVLLLAGIIRGYRKHSKTESSISAVKFDDGAADGLTAIPWIDSVKPNSFSFENRWLQ